MKLGLRRLLSTISDGTFYSSQALATQFGVSRAAIFKSIKQLESLGLSIEAVADKGYRLHAPLTVLSKTEIENKLSIVASKQCQAIDILFNTPSTNSYLLNQLETEQAHSRVVLAEYQSHGRGRQDGCWHSPLGGGLYLSIAWCFSFTATKPGLLSLYTGLAIVRALKTIGVNDVALKWPNDILIDNKKLGGVLIDIREKAGRPLEVVIGIGINYNIPEPIAKTIAQPVTDLCRNMPQRLSRNQVAAAIISFVFEILAQVDSGKTTGLIDEWRQHDYCIGKPARLLSPQNIIEGIVVGIDEQGALLLSIDGKSKRYTSGELSLRLE